MLRIFLAHASEDKPAVRDLYYKLKQCGYIPWLDEIDLLPGQLWRDEIPKAIKASDIFIACLSQQSVAKRGYVQREFRLALNKLSECIPGDIYLIPLLLNDCEIPDLRLGEYGVSLRDVQGLKYYEVDGFERLKQSIDYQIRKTSIAPSKHSNEDSVLLWDDFEGNSLNTNIWKLPTQDTSFIGRTQFSIYEAPLVKDSKLFLGVETFNSVLKKIQKTTPIQKILPSFLGNEIISRQQFSRRNGLALEVKARISYPISRGLVANFYFFDINPNSMGYSGLSNEIDFEILTNYINNTLVKSEETSFKSRIITNVTCNKRLGLGDTSSVELYENLTKFNIFRIEWKSDCINWIVNNTVVRRQTDKTPNRDMDVRLSFWVPGQEYKQAFDSSLQPTLSSDSNQIYYLEVDYVKVERLI